MESIEQKIRQKKLHDKDRTSYYDAAFWGGFAGHTRGFVGGAITGGLLGLGVGMLAAVALPAVGIAGISAVALIAGFGVAGMGVGATVMELVGMNAGSISAALDEHDLRRDREKQIEKERALAKKRGISDEEFDRMIESQDKAEKAHTPKQSLFSMKHLAVGLAIGAALGGLLAFTAAGPALLAAMHLLTDVAMVDGAIATANIAGLGMAVEGGHLVGVGVTTMLGLSASMGALFGVNCSLFQKIFHQTDKLFKGDSAGAKDCTPCQQGRSRPLQPLHQQSPHTHMVNHDTRTDHAAQLLAARENAAQRPGQQTATGLGT